MRNQLTLLLATKGRDNFTIRFLAYANSISLEYPIYIADGEPKNSIKNIINNKKLFPNISYSYNEYDDIGYKEFYNKIKLSLSSIKTKYVMFIDNDDFVLPKGINNCLDFLKKNNDYIGCSSRIGWFYKQNFLFSDNNLEGKITYFFDKTGPYNPRSYSDEKMSDRLEHLLKCYTVTFYSIFDREKLLITSSEISKMNFNYTYSFELYFHLRMISLGKIKVFRDNAFYLRQLGTSLGNDQNQSLLGRQFDLINEILSGRVLQDKMKIKDELISNNFSKSSVSTIEKFLNQYWSSRINNYFKIKRLLNNKIIIRIRKILKKYFPLVKKMLWHFRHYKIVMNSYKVKNYNEVDNVKLFMKNFKLNSYIND